jgi:hypothetical protein
MRNVWRSPVWTAATSAPGAAIDDLAGGGERDRAAPARPREQRRRQAALERCDLV